MRYLGVKLCTKSVISVNGRYVYLQRMSIKTHATAAAEMRLSGYANKQREHTSIAVMK